MHPQLQSGAFMRPLNFTVRFHMTRRALFVVVLSSTLVNSAQAKCMYHPEIAASVTIQGCVAATFGATDTKYNFGPTPSGEDAWPMYRSGDTLSGTVLSVVVRSSHFTWSDATMGHYTNGMHLWAKGESHSLFVRAPPVDVCPKVLPADVGVETVRVCCDTGGWECLLPVNMPLARVVPAKVSK